MRLNQITRLYAFEEGDTITPRMGIRIEPGYGLQQYWDVSTQKVLETDFTKHPATLFPQAYSAQSGQIIVPDKTGSGWYYNNPESPAALIEFDAQHHSTGVFKGLFEETTVNQNGKVFPALKIVGNLANKDDYTDKCIYYCATYKGKKFTCSQVIPIQAAAGSIYTINLSVMGESGQGDAVLSNDNDWVEYTAFLQQTGTSVTSGVIFKFFRMQGGQWQEVTNIPGMTEISSNASNAKLKLYNSAVEGVELYKVEAQHNGNKYEESFEVTDEHDPFYIVPNRSIFGDAVKPGETVSYSPEIYDRSTNAPAVGSYATAKWNIKITFISNNTSKPLSLAHSYISYEEIRNAGGVTAHIEAILK